MAVYLGGAVALYEPTIEGNIIFKSNTAFLLTLDHVATANRTITIPDITDTLVTLTASQELTNKTLTSAVAGGTWTSSGTWTIGAVTLGGKVIVSDDVLLTLGTSSDGVLLNRSTTLNANTALTGVIIGTPVTPALAANSLIIANSTADGDVLIVGNDGGNSRVAMFFDASAPDTILYNVGGTWTVGATTWTIPAVTLGGAVAGGDQTFTGVGDMTFTAGSIEASGSTNGDTLLFRANDTTFITFTTGTTDACELDGCILDTSIAKGTWTASGTWTIPAVTLGGAVAGGDQTFTGVGDMTFTAGSILASGSVNDNTLLLKANDTTFITFTTGTTDACTAANITMSGTWLASGTVTLPALTLGGTTTVNDDIYIQFGGVAGIGWGTTDANANLVKINLPAGGATDVCGALVGIGIAGVDLAIWDGITNTRLGIVDADRDSWFALTFSADDVARFDVGGVAASIGFNVPVEFSSIAIEADAGAINLIDLPISATPAAATEESYSFLIDSTAILTIYGEANGSGGLQNQVIKAFAGVASVVTLAISANSQTLNAAPTATTLTAVNTKSFTATGHNIVLPAITPAANGGGITLTGLNLAQGAISNVADSEAITVKQITITGAAGAALATGIYTWQGISITTPAQAANGAVNAAHALLISCGAAAGGAGAYQRGIGITMAAETDNAILVAAGKMTFTPSGADIDCILPATDARGNLGNASYRWNLVRAVTLTGGDFCFENGYRMTEAEKLGLSPGIALVRPDGSIAQVFN